MMILQYFLVFSVPYKLDSLSFGLIRSLFSYDLWIFFKKFSFVQMEETSTERFSFLILNISPIYRLLIRQFLHFFVYLWISFLI